MPTLECSQHHRCFGRKDVVEHLLQMGANVHARDDGGLIPLHNACSFGHAEVVSLLLCQGADPNARDNWNYTPLHEAAIKGKIDVCIAPLQGTRVAYIAMCVKLLGNKPGCYVLLQHGADPNIRNTDGKSALDLADPSAKAVLTGEYKKDELLEAARSGNEEKLMALLTPLNVNCHASDGRKRWPGTWQAWVPGGREDGRPPSPQRISPSRLLLLSAAAAAAAAAAVGSLSSVCWSSEFSQFVLASS
ncbi:Poly [ADP-ribose] polymerase tankyrase-1 [Galemys pyrenaicus]|uniref:Poly [ADP-ribose] polymerase tankyrase-1 n=1 Tax=Galemys pyrenaicus TaxID=202257 RepID=A0A8J6DJ54_GALPY|nr:Poly [ADP-ribose] polymerase tankyrase-1 [Galemys pyrenaicus]